MKKWIVVSVNAILEVVIIFCFEFTYRIYWGDYLAGDFGLGLCIGWTFINAIMCIPINMEHR